MPTLTICNGKRPPEHPAYIRCVHFRRTSQVRLHHNLYLTYSRTMAAKQRSYTLTEAAQVTGLSRVTIRRYLDAGRFPGAYQDGDVGPMAPWRIPTADLSAAGLEIVGPVAARDVTPPVVRSASDDAQLAVASALADERLRTIGVLEEQVRVLQALLTAALAPGASHGEVK